MKNSGLKRALLSNKRFGFVKIAQLTLVLAGSLSWSWRRWLMGHSPDDWYCPNHAEECNISTFHPSFFVSMLWYLWLGCNALAIIWALIDIFLDKDVFWKRIANFAAIPGLAIVLRVGVDMILGSIG